MLNKLYSDLVGKMPPIMTLFLDPDEEVSQWLANQLAPDEMIIDCGAGLGALGARPELDGKVVGLDLRPNVDMQRSEVIPANAIDYEFNERTVPVFIRPDHGGWVHELLCRHIMTVKRAFYIGKENNLATDLPGEGVEYEVNRVEWFDWEGPDGERVWLVSEPDTRMFEYVLWQDGLPATSEWYLINELDEEDSVPGEDQYTVQRVFSISRWIVSKIEAETCVVFHFVYPGRDESPFMGGGWEGRRWLEEKNTLVRGRDSATGWEKARRAECLEQVEKRGGHWSLTKTVEGRIVEYPDAPMEAWLRDSLRYRHSETEEERTTLNAQRAAVWSNVSPSGLKQSGDYGSHSDLLYCVKVDGKFLKEPMQSWHTYMFRDVRNALEDARNHYYTVLRLCDLDDPGPQPVIDRPMIDLFDRPQTFPKPFTILCGDPKVQEVIRGVVSTPRPGERVAPGAIAVCRNGSVNYDKAAQDSAAMIVGAGGVTCHLVTNYRPEGAVIVRFQHWASLVSGDEIEIDLRHRTVTLLKEGEDARQRLREQCGEEGA